MMTPKEYERRKKLVEKKKEEEKKWSNIKPTKSHLKRLASYLEEVFGWEVFQRRYECPKCENYVLVTTDDPDRKYCEYDGKKLKKSKNQDLSTLDQIEQAIDYAFNHTGTINKYLKSQDEEVM